MADIDKRANNSDADLPAGFKMTELGPLPEEWEVVRLETVATIGNTKTNLPPQAVIPFIPMSYIPDDYLYITSWELHKPEEIRSGVIVRNGDLLLAKITPCLENGKQGIVKNLPGGWGYATTEVFPIRTLESMLLDFLAFYLKRPEVREVLASKMEGTTGRRRLPKSVVKGLIVPFPPLPEQQAIAHVLRTVQQAKEATERVIQAMRELKKSLMRYLFTYGPVPIEEADRVPLKETEIGLVPEHWEVVKLGEVADIKGGKRLPKGHKLSDRPTPYPYIRVVDFKDGSVDKTNLKFLTPQDYENIKQYTISSRDVYISIAGTIGLVGIVPPELDGANLTENAAKIVLRNQAKVDQHFLVYFLASEIGQEQILIRTTKTSQPKLALARIRQIPIPYPSAGEQQEIARILKVVDKKLKAEEARKQVLEELFKTLLHNLMTGKIRVKDLNLYNLV